MSTGAISTREKARAFQLTGEMEATFKKHTGAYKVLCSFDEEARHTKYNCVILHLGTPRDEYNNVHSRHGNTCIYVGALDDQAFVFRATRDHRWGKKSFDLTDEEKAIAARCRYVMRLIL
jgi:hypothetical protein